MAVDRHNLDVAAMLLKRKANTETKEFVTVCGGDGKALGRNKCTPLFAAAASGQIDMVRLLVKYHADLNYVEEFLPPVHDANGYPIGPVMSSPRGSLYGRRTSLDVALANGHAAVASYLKSVGAMRYKSR